jgi:hypothetical protein
MAQTLEHKAAKAKQDRTHAKLAKEVYFNPVFGKEMNALWETENPPGDIGYKIYCLWAAFDNVFNERPDQFARVDVADLRLIASQLARKADAIERGMK